MHRSIVTIVIAVACLGTVGCTKHSEKDDAPITLVGENAESIVVIPIDMSGSFVHLMTKDGKAHGFIMRVADTFFRKSIGGNNRIILAQLSATDRPLLWDGTPQQLRQDFPTPEALRDFLLKNSNPNGSRIHDGVADALDYVLADRGVDSGKTRAALLVLSDFEETMPNPEKSEKRLVDALKAFGRKNGIVGFYFVDPRFQPTWRRHLGQSGVKSWVCESQIVARPTLPTFD